MLTSGDIVSLTDNFRATVFLTKTLSSFEITIPSKLLLYVYYVVIVIQNSNHFIFLKARAEMSFHVSLNTSLN